MSKFDQDIRKKGKVMEDFENELKPEPKPKSSGTKSAKPRPKPESSIKTTDVTDVILLKDETTRKIFGILLICFSLFSLASLVSFLLYWKTDLSILQGEASETFQVVNMYTFLLLF